MNGAPLITVIICTRNRSPLLSAAILSILGQTHPHVEIIVVDDGSTDNTQEVLKTFSHLPQVRCFQQASLGQPVGRNLGLDHATGEFIAFLDDDDELYPAALEHALASLEAHPGVGVAYSDVTVMDEAGQEKGLRANRPLPSGDVYEELAAGRVLCLNGAFLARRACFTGLRYDLVITQSSDVYMACCLAERFHFIFVPEPMLKYRRYLNPKKAVSGNKYTLCITERRYGLLMSTPRFAQTSPAFQRDIVSKYELQLGRGYAKIGDHRNALRHFAASLRRAPFRRATWRDVGASIARWSGILN